MPFVRGSCGLRTDPDGVRRRTRGAMSRIRRKHMFRTKYLVIAAAIIAIAVGAGGAYAWWSSTGTGTGTATASSGGAFFSVAGDPADGIYPGGNSAVTSIATNTSSTQAAYL